MAGSGPNGEPRVTIQQVSCKTLTGHTVLLEFNANHDAFEDIMRRVSQKVFPGFKPTDGTYSNHLMMIREGQRVVEKAQPGQSALEFNETKTSFHTINCVHILPYSDEMKNSLKDNAEKTLEDLNKHTSSPAADEIVDAERIVERLSDLPSFFSAQLEYNQALGMSKNASMLQALTVFSWVASAGFAAGGAAWLSVTSNLSSLVNLNPTALIAVSAVAVFAIASLVFAALGTKSCVKTNREISRINNVFDSTHRFNVTEEECAAIPIARMAPEQ